MQHIGFIMDGNRRFAKRLMLEAWKGHEYGRDKFKEVLRWLKEADVKEATFYAFSAQNFSRPKKEFDFLMKLAREAFKEMLTDEYIKKDDIRVRVVGDLSHFPQDIIEQIGKLHEYTQNHATHIVNIAFGYGGREELIGAIKKLQANGDEVTQENITKHLMVQTEPEIIIRTGGEHRTSNFLPWQSIYSEWFFPDKMWPEFNKDDFFTILDDYKKRERRFGK